MQKPDEIGGGNAPSAVKAAGADPSFYPDGAIDANIADYKQAIESMSSHWRYAARCRAPGWGFGKLPVTDQAVLNRENEGD